MKTIKRTDISRNDAHSIKKIIGRKDKILIDAYNGKIEPQEIGRISLKGDDRHFVRYSDFRTKMTVADIVDALEESKCIAVEYYRTVIFYIHKI